MTFSGASLIGLLSLFSVTVLVQAATPREVTLQSNQLSWVALPSQPDREGFAASFAGVSGGALLVAGGANFPDKKPWENGTKVWHDSVFALEETNSTWRVAGKLPRPLAYGLSVSIPDGVLCAGGSDAQRHYADVFVLQWMNGQLRKRAMPPLPTPCANMCGALIGNVLYVAGGLASPSATNALKSFWSLDLNEQKPQWRALESWPGRPRMLAAAGSHAGSFYLFSGVDLHGGDDGKAVRTYLRDAYQYTPQKGWRRLADLPRAAAAAPSPAPVQNSRFLIVSGDDGTLTHFEPKDRHPGFPREVLAFDPATDRWTNLGPCPLSLATAPVVEWRRQKIIVSGETRPGVRSPAVWSLK